MTPIRDQYLRIKQGYPDAIVLFRLGDFYETFDEDARLASRELDVVLTSKPMGKGIKVPLAGIPAHSLESYLARLIKKGHKVAICEQLSDPATSKGLLERDVVRVVTPGTVVEPSLLDQKANNYLAAVAVEGEDAGLAYVDITTGEYRATQLPTVQLAPELHRISPAELLVAQGQEAPAAANGYPVTPLPTPAFAYDGARQRLLDHFRVATLEPFGCADFPLAVRAAGRFWNTSTGPSADPSRISSPSTPTPPASTWPSTPRPDATWSSSRGGAGATPASPCTPPWT